MITYLLAPLAVAGATFEARLAATLGMSPDGGPAPLTFAPPDAAAPAALATFVERHAAALHALAAGDVGLCYIHDPLDAAATTPMGAGWARAFRRARIGGYAVVFATLAQLRGAGLGVLAQIAPLAGAARATLVHCRVANPDRPDEEDLPYLVAIAAPAPAVALARAA